MHLIEKLKMEFIPMLEEFGYELVDIELSTKHSKNHLTVFIDSLDGITLDDCEKAHRALDMILDKLDPLESAYVFNVSSPGLDRPFKYQRDFERNYNKEVEIKLINPLKGKKYLSGHLIHRDANFIAIKNEEAEIKIENSKISFVRPLVRFS